MDERDVGTLIKSASGAIAALERQAGAITQVAQLCAQAVTSGRTLLSCGNGGSSAQAMHLSEELVGRFRNDRAPLPAVCLNADPTAITCIANDFGFDQIFARPINAIAKAGDVLVVFTTSGKSTNILEALRAARAQGVTTIGLLGKGGGPAATLCDHAIVVDHDASERIQECHQVILHLICEACERAAATIHVRPTNAHAKA
ncbi:MAG: SIS domain-containing protein [Phycisphaerales bacterium]|nr:SIS domain-containing protein [Phycisphaerales bacterium]